MTRMGSRFVIVSPAFPRTYFFTVVIEHRQLLLIHADVRTVLRKAIVLMPETLPFHIDGWILLADHLHAI